MNNDNSTSHQYDERYSAHKDWSEKSFGSLFSSDARYFDKEMKRAGFEIESGAKVLEVGFGNGKFMSYAKRRNWEITGTELNSNLIAVAQARGFKVKASATLEWVANESLDLIVAFDVLEHLTATEIAILLRQVKSALKKGGIFLARFPNGDSPFGLINQNGDVTHVTAIGYGKARYFAECAGLIIQFYGGRKNIIIKKNPLLVVKNVGGYMLRLLINSVARCLYEYKFDFSASDSVMILRRV